MPPKEIKKVIHKDVVYYSVPDAARYLGTTATKIRNLIGSDELQSARIRANGKDLVTAKSLVDYKYKPKDGGA